MALWMVRAGRHGERENYALEKRLAVIGWDELPDLAGFKSQEAMLGLLKRVYGVDELNKLDNWSRQLWAFVGKMQKGDLVALPLKGRPSIAIGQVAGDYRYEGDGPSGAKHVRRVDWIREFARGDFEQDLRHSFGAFLTVCRIERNNAERRVRDLLGGQTPPAAGAARRSEEAAPQAPLDIETVARDQIAEFVARKFRSHDLSHLVAAILGAQGYRVRVSPAGPDGGVDILAGRGDLGFDAPRLAVQVKSGADPVDVKVLRELQGVMKNFGAQQGLLVSLGGFKGSVDKEAARLFFEVRLWSADDVVTMIQSHYDRLPADWQAALPLKRIWTMALGEDSNET